MKLTKRDFVLFGIIIYFTFIGGTFYSQLNFSLRVANQIIVTVILGIWLLTRLRRGEGLPSTHLDLALALYLAANFITALTGQSARFSLETFWLTVVHVLAFYLLVGAMRRGWAPKLAWAFYMASAVVCVVGLVEFVAWYIGSPLLPGVRLNWLEIGGWRQPIPPQIYRLAITLNGPTILSAYLALLIPPAIALVLGLPRWDQNRQALILWLILAFMVQLLAASRSGVLALGMSLPLTALAWYNLKEDQRGRLIRLWRRIGPLYRALFVVGLILVVGVGLFWLQRSLVSRAYSTGFRITLWAAATTLFQDHFFTGVGLANFGRGLLRLNDAALPRLQIASAHNLYMNMAAETGLVGLLAGAYLLLALGRTWFRRWRQTPEANRQERLLVAACGAALAGIAVQALVDTYQATPVILLVAALAAYIAGGLPERRPALKRQYLASLALAILGIYTAGLFWMALADSRYRESFQAEAQGSLSEAIVAATESQRLDPALTLRIFRLALLEARLAYQIGDVDLVSSAVAHYRLGLEQEPILGLNSANLAGLLWQQGQRAEAIATLEDTVAAEPDPIYLVNLGYYHEQEGHWPQAAAAYGYALARSPRLAGSGFWQASPGRAARWTSFVEEAVKQYASDSDLAQTRLRVNLALAREDFDAAEAIMTPVTAPDDSLRAALAEVYLHRAQPEQALALLDPAPTNSRAYLLWGQAKLQLGDHEEAETLLKTAAFLGQSQAYYYLGQLFEQQSRLQEAQEAYQRGFFPRTTSENVEVTIYGRRAGNDLIPQMVRIGLNPAAAASWLALARLYENEQRFGEARQVYQLLLAEDPFLTVARERLNSIQ